VQTPFRTYRPERRARQSGRWNRRGITSPSRLHFALIDLNAELGRVDGGIGVALNEPSLAIEVSAVDKAVEREENPEAVVPVLKRIRSRIEPELRGH
jgi:beta-ribofuranosylaminobenzene 5'-phosphate synthase